MAAFAAYAVEKYGRTAVAAQHKAGHYGFIVRAAGACAGFAVLMLRIRHRVILFNC